MDGITSSACLLTARMTTLRPFAPLNETPGDESGTRTDDMDDMDDMDGMDDTDDIAAPPACLPIRADDIAPPCSSPNETDERDE